MTSREGESRKFLKERGLQFMKTPDDKKHGSNVPE